MGRIANGKSPQLQQLRPWHSSIARAMVAGGLRPKDLCAIFQLSPSQISVITNSPLFVAERERLESLAEYEACDVRTELEMRQACAIDVLDEALTNGDLRMKKDVALEILDRTGYGKKVDVQKHAHLHLHKDVSDMDDEELYEAALGAVGGDE